MEIPAIIFVSILLFSYFLGIVAANGVFSKIIDSPKPLTTLWRLASELFNSWNDWLFIMIVSLAAIFFISATNGLWKSEDIIQTLIVIATFASVVYATIVREKASRYRERPKIEIKFDSNDSEYYHQTIMSYGVKDDIEYLPTYYIRLKIENCGKRTMNNVEVVLEDITPKPEKFTSLNLSWAGFIPSMIKPDIKRSVRIPQGQSRIVDVIEVTEPEQTRSFLERIEKQGKGSIEERNRLKKMVGGGFRTCTIKPNTLSDILISGKYVFHLGVYADEVEPKFAKLEIEYGGNWGTEGIEGMRNRHLKVRLLR